MGLALPLRGMRLGVTTTAGTLGGVLPRTFAIGDEFHLGRASMGIRPPVPVPRFELGRPTELLFVLGANIGTCKRLVLEDDEAVVIVDDVERLRVVGLMTLSRRAEGAGREDTRFPGRTDDALDEVGPVGEAPDWVKVAEVVVVELLLESLPADRGRGSSVTIVNPFT